MLATDLGRPIGDVTRKFTDDQLIDDCHAMLETRTAVEREVRADSGQYYSRRVLPYWTAEHQLEGVVITFIDLTDRKRAADLVDDARIYAESIVATVREPLVVLDASLRVRSANPSFFEAFGLRPDETVDRPIFSLGTGEWDLPPVRRLLEEMLERQTEIVDFELVLPSPRLGPRTMLLNARMIPGLDGQSEHDPRGHRRHHRSQACGTGIENP